MALVRHCLGMLVAGVLLAPATQSARADDTAKLAALERTVAALADRLQASEQRVTVLEQRLQAAAGQTEATKTALETELSQPMLLLVGSTAECPVAFKRITTHAIILTRTRTLETGPLLDEAGLSWEDPPGVGFNVYRDFQLCFRPKRAVKITDSP